MKDGHWLMPRYSDRGIFEIDFPSIDINALEVYCPGCRSVVALTRKSPMGKIAGWCRKCNRPVTS